MNFFTLKSRSSGDEMRALMRVRQATLSDSLFRMRRPWIVASFFLKLEKIAANKRPKSSEEMIFLGGDSRGESHIMQSWAISEFFNFFINKKSFFAFFIKLN